MSETFKFDWQRRILRSELNASLKFTALVLSVYASGDGSSIRPGLERLASDLSRSDSTVRRNLSALKELGWIHQVRRGGRAKGGRSWASVYRLRYPSATQAAADHDEAVAEARPDLHQGSTDVQPLTHEHPSVNFPSTDRAPKRGAPSTPHAEGVRSCATSAHTARDAIREGDTAPAADQPREETLEIVKLTKLGNGMWDVIYSNGIGQKLDYKPTEPTPWAQQLFEKSKETPSL